MNDNRNMMLAIGLSVAVLVVWQLFVGLPQMEKQREAARLQQQQQQQQQQQPTQSQTPQPSQPGQAPRVPPDATNVQPGTLTREQALAPSPRVAIETPRLKGSIALKGARIDDVALVDYHETVDPKSPNIVLLSPAGSAEPFYAEFRLVNAGGGQAKLPNAETVWTVASTPPLTPARPLVLTWDNGEGLRFQRTIAIDRDYMFTVADEVENRGTEAVTVHSYGLVSRHGLPQTSGYAVLHEGPVGVIGGSLVEPAYKDLEKPSGPVKSQDGWLGITDKYWAAILVPDQAPGFDGHFFSTTIGQTRSYDSEFLGPAASVAPGSKASLQNRLFAGAKEVAVVDRYEADLGIKRFDRLIDWGWFYFITKPLFKVLDYFYRVLGNFGLSILLVTVLIKLVFFPLANKSYASMAKMKAVQPEMQRIREQYADDKVKQQQELMDLYKRQKINPVAGCLPIVIQIPVFFALYKVLFITIEMRHAPFYGWIKDLSAPDPTNIFNLFGLIPVDPTVLPLVGPFLHLGIWPLIMGVTMWVQMKMNPAPPDPTQKMIFDWMPIFFTFMLGSFAAGLVIYWAWNNTLSVLQQGVIMRKHGAKIELFDNLKGLFKRTPAS